MPGTNRIVSRGASGGRAGGFTLIEMLVVFAVFAILGVISSQIVSRVLDNQRIMKERGDRLSQVQRAMQIIQRDVMQITGRQVRDELGSPLVPVMIGADGLMEFTRLGWRNPLSLPRSEVQRMAYVVEDGDLYRLYWPVLDRAPDSEPVRQSLLEDVDQVEFFALDGAGEEHSFWPIAGGGGPGGNPLTALAGIVLRIDLAPFGAIERVWMVASPL